MNEKLQSSYPEELSLIAPPDPMLRGKALPVGKGEISSKPFQEFLDRMFRFAGGEQGDESRPVLVGLAAPQIGVMKRVILVDTGANGKGKVGGLQEYINPEILEAAVEEEEWYEGCFSTGNVTGIVSRPVWVRIKAEKRNGEVVQEEHFGYRARIFQHEIDHLNGIRFPERVSKEGGLHFVEPHEFGEYRNQEGWRNWKRKCPWEEWIKISSS